MTMVMKMMMAMMRKMVSVGRRLRRLPEAQAGPE
jgi:hypothetical protein